MENSIHNLMISYAPRINEGSFRPIDFSSGIFAASFGMANETIANAIYNQAHKCMHAYQYNTPVKERYLRKLCEFTGYESAYMFSSGTEAVEAAWKIARRHTRKDGIIGLTGAFHGKTFGAQIAAGKERDWRNQTSGEKTAAIIMEPYTALTVDFHNARTIERIVQLKEMYNLILIADEIQAGFFRTGKLFGYEWYPQLKPDLVCIGKAMANGFPASAVLGPKELIDNPMMDLSSTNGGNPLACAAGLAVLDILKNSDVLPWLDKKVEIFWHELFKLEQPSKGRGLVASIWFPTVQKADQAVVDLCKSGLLVIHTKHQTIKLAPPLNISREALSDGLQILKEVLNESS